MNHSDAVEMHEFCIKNNSKTQIRSAKVHLIALKYSNWKSFFVIENSLHQSWLTNSNLNDDKCWMMLAFQCRFGLISSVVMRLNQFNSDWHQITHESKSRNSFFCFSHELESIKKGRHYKTQSEYCFQERWKEGKKPLNHPKPLSDTTQHQSIAQETWCWWRHQFVPI